MKPFENTFIRGSSPCYSEDAATANVMSATLPIGSADVDHMQSSMDHFLDEKFTFTYHSTPSLTKAMNHHRNTFAFWVIVSVILVLTVANLMLTLTIIGVLRLGKGVHGMELIPEEDVIKFYGSTDLDRIYSKTFGEIEGFNDVPVTITGDDGSVYIRLHRNGQAYNRLIVNKSGIQFRAVNSFEIKDITGNSIFSTHRPNYNMPTGADALITKTLSTSRIASPIEKPLTIEADGRVSIKGSEGIVLDASAALFQAEHNIAINSTQGSTILEAGSGIYLNLDKIPIVSSEFGLRTGSVQYKICCCMPQGILFRIPVPRLHNGPKISCAHFSSKFDPCAIN